MTKKWRGGPVPVFGFTLESLRALPTLSVGQADNLKFDEGGYRIWLCRCGVADGMPYDNQTTIERFEETAGRWVDAYTFEPKPGEHYGLLAMLYLGGYQP
jgi:hypothetical protein